MQKLLRSRICFAHVSNLISDETIPAHSIPIPIPIPLTVGNMQPKWEKWCNDGFQHKISGRFNSDSDSINLEKGSIPIPIAIPESELSHLWT